MRTPISTWFFVLVVVRQGRRFLLVHEKKHQQLWYLPAGRVEPGEALDLAAERETLEESGVPITLEGVLRVEHSPSPEGWARVRVIFVAHPTDDTPPRATENEHSLEAGWFTVEEMRHLPLRGEEVREIAEYVLAGGTIHPLGVLDVEGGPWRKPAPLKR